MASLDDEEELFLARARRHLSPTSADVTRVIAAARIAGFAPVPAAGRNAGGKDATTAKVVGLLPAALAALALSIGAAGVAYRLGFEQGKREPVPPLPALWTSQSVVTLVPLPEESHEGSFAAASAPSAGRATPGPVASASSGALEDELAALKKVERALREQRPRDALAFLDQLDHTAPKGRLFEERAAARTLALCDLRPAAEARPLAVQFSKRFPGSVYEPRVVKGCAGLPSTLEGDRNEQ